MGSSVSKHTNSYAQRNKYKNDFRDSGGISNQSMEEHEYALYRSEELTKTLDDRVKIAKGIIDDATNTQVIIHKQGEQITRARDDAGNINYGLSLGLNLLGSLGGIFSRSWKPKKSTPAKGLAIFGGDPVWRNGNHLVQRVNLRLKPASNGSLRSRIPRPEPTNALRKFEVEEAKQDVVFSALSDALGMLKVAQVEEAKQDVALSALSDALGMLKVLAINMGKMIDQQNKALDNQNADVHTVNGRLRQANQRERLLLGI